MTRKKLFLVIAVIMSLVTLSASASWCTISSEWSDAFSEFIFETYYIVYLLYGALNFGAVFGTVTVLTAVAWAVFGANSVRRYTQIFDDEIKFTKRSSFILSASTLTAALIIMTVRTIELKSFVPLGALLYCWQNPLFMRLFYIKKLAKTQTV